MVNVLPSRGFATGSVVFHYMNTQSHPKVGTRSIPTPMILLKTC